MIGGVNEWYETEGKWKAMDMYTNGKTVENKGLNGLCESYGDQSYRTRQG